MCCQGFFSHAGLHVSCSIPQRSVSSDGVYHLEFGMAGLCGSAGSGWTKKGKA